MEILGFGYGPTDGDFHFACRGDAGQGGKPMLSLYCETIEFSDDLQSRLSTRVDK